MVKTIKFCVRRPKIKAIQHPIKKLIFFTSRPIERQNKPGEEVLQPGDNTSITCEATGAQPIFITWERVRQPLPRSVKSFKGKLLRIQDVAVSDAGTYFCMATNRDGNVFF